MALLQISDPAARPHAIGIDLGTTHSLVAHVPAVGGPVAIADCDGDVLVPSAVHYSNAGAIVGRAALACAAQSPHDTILSVKRLMGRNAADAGLEHAGPYRFDVSDPRLVRMRVAGDRTVSPVEVSAEILRALALRARDALGPIGGAVITVPAYFDDAQRQATKDAGRLAGLDVLRLLNEPTAAALAYGLEKRRNGTFVIYDLGGGTFDVTVLSLDDGVFHVRATGGDTQLGGDDFDRLLAAHMLEKIERATATHAGKSQLSGGQMPGSQLRVGQPVALSDEDRVALRQQARALKHALSSAEYVDAEVILRGDESRRIQVSRAEFEALIAPLVDRTLRVVRQTLRDAKLDAGAVDGVVLVGGSTRVPLVRAKLRELFGQEPLADIDPDQVVALGAAIQAELLAGTAIHDDVLLLDVLPLSLGIETMGGIVERILPRNTPVPASATQVFTTYADDQTGYVLHVVQGERELARDCRSLAHFTLRGIPALPAGMARLEVTFEVDADGMLHVSARELTTGVAQAIDVQPTYGLSADEMERMLLDAFAHGDSDVAERAVREQRVEAERIAHATERALAVDADLLSAEERRGIDLALERLYERAAGADHHAIMGAIEELDRATQEFAARRMNRGIGRALSGQAVADFEHA